MELNSSVIPHYTCKEIPVSELKKEVSNNEATINDAIKVLTKTK